MLQILFGADGANSRNYAESCRPTWNSDSSWHLCRATTLIDATALGSGRGRKALDHIVFALIDRAEDDPRLGERRTSWHCYCALSDEGTRCRGWISTNC